MVMVKYPKGEYYMDGYLKSAYDTAKKVILKDWDFVFIIDGTEGGGKSVLAQQGATYCDQTFNVGRIAFTPKEFREKIIHAKQYEAVIYDEAYTGLSSRGTMTDINKVLVSMLAEIRQKNLFVFIVMPTFFDLDKYVALWRSRALIHIYTGDSFERGYLSFYNTDRKKDLFVNGKKYYSYYKPKPNFIGRFTNAYTVDEVEYRRLKLKALNDHSDAKKTKDDSRFMVALHVLYKSLSIRDIQKELKESGLMLSIGTIHSILNTFTKE